MPAAPNLNRLKQQLDRLRKDSVSVVATANKIVYSGVQKLADKELRALNDYYRSALASVRSVNRRDGIRGLAQQQLDLLQDTVNQVIANARESMVIVAQTRAELADFVQKSLRGEKVTPSSLAKATAPARKAVVKTGKAARKAAKAVAKAAPRAAKRARTGPAPKPARKLAAGAKRAVHNAAEAIAQAAETAGSTAAGVAHAVADAVKPND